MESLLVPDENFLPFCERFGPVPSEHEQTSIDVLQFDAAIRKKLEKRKIRTLLNLSQCNEHALSSDRYMPEGSAVIVREKYAAWLKGTLIVNGSVPSDEALLREYIQKKALEIRKTWSPDVERQRYIGNYHRGARKE